MTSTLILFASANGQAERIAERIAATLKRAGHKASAASIEALDLEDLISACDAVIVGGSVQYGHHARRLEAVVRDNRSVIDERPNAFFSVSMSAGGPGAKPAAATGYVDEFITRTGWNSKRIASFAGALRYTRYNPLTRLMMRLIAGASGGETDTSRDYEYTDWDAVERFAVEFAGLLEPAHAA